MSPRAPRSAAALLGAALLLAALAACRAPCPPEWLEQPPTRAGWLYASGSAGSLGLEIDPARVALVRAARRLAAQLGLDVSAGLSVTPLGAGLVVEAWGPDGPVHALDDLELVAGVRCGDRRHVLVRLPAPDS